MVNRMLWKEKVTKGSTNQFQFTTFSKIAGRFLDFFFLLLFNISKLRVEGLITSGENRERERSFVETGLKRLKQCTLEFLETLDENALRERIDSFFFFFFLSSKSMEDRRGTRSRSGILANKNRGTGHEILCRGGKTKSETACSRIYTRREKKDSS